MNQKQFYLFSFLIITALGFFMMARRSQEELLHKRPGQTEAFQRKFHPKK